MLLVLASLPEGDCNILYLAAANQAKGACLPDSLRRKLAQKRISIGKRCAIKVEQYIADQQPTFFGGTIRFDAGQHETTIDLGAQFRTNRRRQGNNLCADAEVSALNAALGQRLRDARRCLDRNGEARTLAERPAVDADDPTRGVDE